jgi:hypothetical protein
MMKAALSPPFFLVIGIGVFVSAPINAASTKPSFPDGIYKGLKYVQESGDLLGMAVDIRHIPQPIITVTTCEGGCYGGKSWPLTIKGQSIHFDVCDDVVDQSGRPAKCNPIHYVGQFRSDGALVVFMQGEPSIHHILRKEMHPKKDEVRKLACMDHC